MFFSGDPAVRNVLYKSIERTGIGRAVTLGASGVLRKLSEEGKK